LRTLVLDASVAAKWVLPRLAEPLTDQALNLLKDYAIGNLRIVVPDLFWSELANIFWKAARQARWSAVDAQKAMSAVLERNFQTIPAIDLLEEALKIALAFDRSVYDSLYVAAAFRSKSIMVTADEKLANALAARLPVKWLAAVS
jgi:predicted nucleic acid-binding protein